MKPIVLLDTSYPINNRNIKIVNSLKKIYPESDIHIITWDRQNDCTDIPENYHIFSADASLGDRLKKAILLRRYRKFIKEQLQIISCGVIIASHWDTLILSSSLKRKNQILIYENLDIPTGHLVRHVFKCFEYMALLKTDLIIHASRFYKVLYPNKIPQIIIENKPDFKKITDAVFIEHKPLRISFIGSIRYYNVLCNLVDSVRDNDNYILYFHGYGEDYDRIKSYAKYALNIKFTGKYNYENIQDLYLQSDVVWAAYPNDNYNVKYAISNKFHESLYMGIPCIYADKTKLGDYVRRNKLGFVVDPYSVNSIKIILKFILDKKIRLKDIHDSMERFVRSEKSWDEDISQLSSFLSSHL